MNVCMNQTKVLRPLVWLQAAGHSEESFADVDYFPRVGVDTYKRNLIKDVLST
jgi:hypothetical protein